MAQVVTPLLKDPQVEAARTPPHSIEAEQSVLGGLLLDNSAWDRVADVITEADFYRADHRAIFQHIAQLIDGGKPADALTAGESLERSGKLAEIGGHAYLGSLAANTPSAANIRRYAEIVRERAIMRSLAAVGTAIADAAFTPMGKTAAQMLDEAEGRVFEIAEAGARGKSGFVSIEDLAARVVTRMDELYHSENPSDITGIPTGYTDLDSRTSGLQPSDLIIVAGRPSMGKTAFALNIARNVARNGGCVAIFSLEMTTRQLVLRMLMAEAQLDLKRFHKGVLGERDMRSLANAAQELEGAKIFIDDSGLVSMTDITAKSRRLDREQKLTFMVVDYIQLISSRSQRDRNREQEVAEVSRTLKLLAKELDIPILALSQLSRKPEERADKRPMLSDLRESGAIEQDADRVMFIYRDEFYDENSADLGVAELILAKQRNGPTGKVRLKFDKEYARFGNLARDGQQPPDSGFGLDAEPPF
jgi:replicative DNA helicase